MVSGPTVSTEAEPVDDDLSEVLWLLWLLYAPALLAPPWPPPPPPQLALALGGAAVQSEADWTDWCESESPSMSAPIPSNSLHSPWTSSSGLSFQAYS